MAVRLSSSLKMRSQKKKERECTLFITVSHSEGGKQMTEVSFGIPPCHCQPEQGTEPVASDPSPGENILTSRGFHGITAYHEKAKLQQCPR